MRKIALLITAFWGSTRRSNVRAACIDFDRPIEISLLMVSSKVRIHRATAECPRLQEHESTKLNLLFPNIALALRG